MKFIPVSEPLVKEKEAQYVLEALKGGWISSSGEFIEKFEGGFSSYIGRKYGVAVNNGTNALIVALRALDLPEGSEVIVPTFTIISCALACIYNGLVPVFVDAAKSDWNMDASKIEEKISARTKAIMAVHIYGFSSEMDKIKEIAKKYNLYLIEDFAEAIGTLYKGKNCGSFGDISCASFYANKVISTGEGGMCLTDDAVLSEKIKSLRNLTFKPAQRFVHDELGFNFRMTNIQAAIGLAQLERIESHIAKKIWMGQTYNELLADLEKKGLLQLPPKREDIRNSYWMYGIVLNELCGLNAVEAIELFRKKDIETRPFFYPLHLQPAFKKFSWHKKESLPVSENLYLYGIYLPSGLTLSEEDTARVAQSLKEILPK